MGCCLASFIVFPRFVFSCTVTCRVRCWAWGQGGRRGRQRASAKGFFEAREPDIARGSSALKLISYRAVRWPGWCTGGEVGGGHCCVVDEGWRFFGQA